MMTARRKFGGCYTRIASDVKFSAHKNEIWNIFRKKAQYFREGKGIFLRFAVRQRGIEKPLIHCPGTFDYQW